MSCCPKLNSHSVTLNVQVYHIRGRRESGQNKGKEGKGEKKDTINKGKGKGEVEGGKWGEWVGGALSLTLHQLPSPYHTFPSSSNFLSPVIPVSIFCFLTQTSSLHWTPSFKILNFLSVTIKSKNTSYFIFLQFSRPCDYNDPPFSLKFFPWHHGSSSPQISS